MREIYYLGKFEDEFLSLDKSIQLRIDSAVDKLLDTPELGKPLKNELAGFRTKRVGSYRVIYKFDEKYVYLYACKKRKEVYK